MIVDPQYGILQKEICVHFGAPFFGCNLDLRVGVSESVRSGARPLNGVRKNPDDIASGWYIWGGEDWSDSPDFFVPLHGIHLIDWIPLVLKYLALPPGWRFLVTKEYQDVWGDNGIDLSKD